MSFSFCYYNLGYCIRNIDKETNLIKNVIVDLLPHTHTKEAKLNTLMHTIYSHTRTGYNHMKELVL